MTQRDGYGLNSIGILALTWVDQDAVPRVLVEMDLTIVWANLAARSAMATRRDLENRAGILTCTSGQYQPQLQDFIVKSGVGVSSLCVPRPDGDGLLVIRSQRIEWSVNGVFGVSFFGSGSDFRPRYANLNTIFGLTSTEHRVLLELLEGKEAEKIAASNKVLIATVRSHIKSIYQKLDVSSREALFHRVMPFRV